MKTDSVPCVSQNHVKCELTLKIWETLGLQTDNTTWWVLVQKIKLPKLSLVREMLGGNKNNNFTNWVHWGLGNKNKTQNLTCTWLSIRACYREEIGKNLIKPVKILNSARFMTQENTFLLQRMTCWLDLEFSFKWEDEDSFEMLG